VARGVCLSLPRCYCRRGLRSEGSNPDAILLPRPVSACPESADFEYGKGRRPTVRASRRLPRGNAPEPVDAMSLPQRSLLLRSRFRTDHVCRDVEGSSRGSCIAEMVCSVGGRFVFGKPMWGARQPQVSFTKCFGTYPNTNRSPREMRDVAALSSVVVIVAGVVL
jgi:hypothetical protein